MKQRQMAQATQVMIGGWIAVIVLSVLVLHIPRTPKEICTSQGHTGISLELCIHKLS